MLEVETKFKVLSIEFNGRFDRNPIETIKTRLKTPKSVMEKMERIGKLFKSLQGDHSSDEVAAGIERLEFGAFGIVDWYAQRMGIIDHEEVFATPWARIFQCMKIDHEQGEFEKRYRKIIENRSKIKR